MSIRVMLVDDHQIVRDGLRSLLAREMDIEVVGEAETGRDAIPLAMKLRPDVILMDITMRGLNGIDATRQLIADIEGMRVIALSMHSDRRYVADMLSAGASGYLMKDSAFEELSLAIRTVMSGRTYLSEGVAQIVVDDYVQRVSGKTPAEGVGSTKPLSTREREVLQLMAEGHSTKAIAGMLHLSVKTVETHRRQIMEKLRIFNVAGLIKYAVREGLASLDE
ncbi:MAG: DNA-binding response regulator [Actinobacteria bacterium HGW-Actinobacteria-10]|nr:MAG: DNA-binding response regulator [Actinobacteria bacterium HGW-Actinobacteria-10]